RQPPPRPDPIPEVVPGGRLANRPPPRYNAWNNGRSADPVPGRSPLRSSSPPPQSTVQPLLASPTPGRADEGRAADRLTPSATGWDHDVRRKNPRHRDPGLRPVLPRPVDGGLHRLDELAGGVWWGHGEARPAAAAAQHRPE